MIRWLAILPLLAASAGASTLQWQELSPGVLYATTTLSQNPGGVTGLLHIVRIDPGVAHLRFHSIACSGSSPRTAAEWCRKEHLTAAINLGMYQQDYRSNVGHARCGTCINNPAWSSAYRSALVFGP